MNQYARLIIPALAAAALALLGACSSPESDGPPNPAPTLSPEETTDGGATQAAPNETADTEITSGPGAVVRVGDDEEYRITDAAQPVTVECVGRGDVKVHAAAVVTITGANCDDIEVRADGAVLEIEASEDLDIEGNGNIVTIGAVADVDIKGNENVVTATQIRSDIEVEGNDNTVSFSDGSPKIEDEGTGNTIG
ncbi:hypothetical protein GCM10028820_04770 [Tessaracoccus terricola]